MTDLEHQLWLHTLSDELHLAPIKNPQHVLDMGTGTGIWAIQFGEHPQEMSIPPLNCQAEKYLSSQVVGNDLSPIQPL